MKTISILIPIYNRLNLTMQGLDLLCKSLEQYALNGNKGCAYDIVIIDDGSTDGSAAWIRANYPKIHILTGDGNLWWSGAINMGAMYAVSELKSEYLLLWNDDVIPADDYFIQMSAMICDEKLQNKIVGSKILIEQNPNLIWSVGGFFNRFTGKAGMYSQMVNPAGNYMECDWQPGMGTLIPTQIITEFDLWWDNKRFPQYHGDSDYVLRCKNKGIKITTNLSLVLYNRTEFSGLIKKQTMKDLYYGLTSIRSNYNFYRNLMFYTSHGYLPFAYYGLFRKYFLYIGGYIRHSIFKL